jgi:hypothetical protein
MMFPEPEYAQNIVVGVIFHNTFAWYVTDRGDWYLDYTKWDRALLASGYKNSPLGDHSSRFDIAILNEETAEDFLTHRADKQVPASALSQMMVARSEADQEDELLDFAPCLLVNFDQRQLFSQYPEMIRFEAWVPDGWTGAYRDFLPEVPENAKYWIVNGQNLYEKE